MEAAPSGAAREDATAWMEATSKFKDFFIRRLSRVAWQWHVGAAEGDLIVQCKDYKCQVKK